MRPVSGRRTALLLLRFVIAAVLLATAAGKMADIRGFAEVLGTYRAFADGALLPVAVMVTVAELGLALWLLAGRRLFAASLASTFLHLVYAGWSAAAIFRGLKLANCGCFGVFFKRPLNWTTVYEDLALTGVSAALAALVWKRT